MKFITVPEPIVLIDLITGSRIRRHLDNGEIIDEPPITMAKFLMTMLLVDVKFGKGLDTIISASNIKKAFDKAAPGEVVSLEDEDHALLVEVMKSPTNPYPPILALQYVPFFRAISLADPIRPETK